MPALSDRQLCLITDPALPDWMAQVQKALTAGVTMLQLRGHELSASQLYVLATQLLPACRHNGVKLIINDRVDVGLAVHCDGFQLGQRSLTLQCVRRIAGKHYLLGASIHTLADLTVAKAEGADFVLAGTIFPSTSHPGGPTTGLDTLRDIQRVAEGVPVIAVGGITLENAASVMETGVAGIAVISAILRSHDVIETVKELRRIVDASIP